LPDRIKTAIKVDSIDHRGVLHYVLRNLAKSAQAPTTASVQQGVDCRVYPFSLSRQRP
tara:strand:+ start:2603 stop:2776 length:174 start_codon:yes stop_codon:yes gene_type:complete